MQRVHVTRDVVFDKTTSWDWEKETVAGDRAGEEFVVEYTVAPTDTPRQRPVSISEIETTKTFLENVLVAEDSDGEPGSMD
jgi:hypothetical protein